MKRGRESINSSDTDQSSPKKRIRRPTRPTQEAIRPPQRQFESDLEILLRCRLSDSSDYAALCELKGINVADQNVMHAVQNIIDNIRSKVQADIDNAGEKVLEVELYLNWLRGLDFVLTAMENALGAKMLGPRNRRVQGLGRITFSILYLLLDEYIAGVNAHQDRWSYRYPTGPVKSSPLVMSMAEEAKDPSADERSDVAIRHAERILSRYDSVMESAVRRYKSECNKKLMAAGIGRREDSLTKACCLLSEQTGYGSSDDMSFSLLVKTRMAMMKWKEEFLTSESTD